MNRILIGNDIFIQVAVTRMGGDPEDFTGVQSMEVVLWHMFHRSNRKPVTYAVSGNTISIRFNAPDQEEAGWYGISVSYAKPDDTSESGVRNYAVDVPFAFELIKSSDYECCPVCPASQDEPLELCANVSLCKDGKDGLTPHIGDNGNWFIGSADTGVPAKGKDGLTPHIGDNGNWFIGSTDTGIPAKGKDGLTPHIGENGNWFIGLTDTGVSAKGKDGINGNDGMNGADGTVLWPSIRIDSSGMLILDLPGETEGNVLSLDGEGYLCLDLTDL